MAVSGDNVKISPLGGLGEIGMNMMAYETADTLVVVDCGALFPENPMLGIDLIIPDFTYLHKNRKKFAGVLITHCHEDHVGGLPFLLREFSVPVYASPFSAAFIEMKLKDRGLRSFDVRSVEPGEAIAIGDLTVTPVEVTHSVVDTTAYALETPAGVIVHTGDFKIDLTPTDDALFDFNAFSDLGREGVRLLMMDSTNSLEEGNTISEMTAAASFDNIMRTHQGRLLVTLFSSSIPRIISLVELAAKHNRKVSVVGRSLRQNVELARMMGYIDAPDSLFVEPEAIKDHTPRRLLVLLSGSQGEARSALTRVSFDEHPHVKILHDDLVIFSARQIPGNERYINKVMGNLMLQGASIYTDRGLGRTHASGHAYRNELRTMLQLTDPEFFIPIHGEPMHLVTNRRLAAEMGVGEDNSLLLMDGDSALLTPDGLFTDDPVPCGWVYVDGKGVGDVTMDVARERKKMAMAGMVTISLVLNAETWAIRTDPVIEQRGVTDEAGMDRLRDDATAIIERTVEEFLKKHNRNTTALAEEIRIRIRRLFKRELDRQPVVVPLITDL